jgi:predicted SnoaL-like aldol condensation-catalyzing enzyme
MKIDKKIIVLFLLLLAFQIHVDGLAKSASDQLQENKKLVLDFFRVVFEAENADAANQYLAEDYIQHNPKVPTGRDGFIKYFKAKWKEPKQVSAELKEPPQAVVAEGDLVTLMWKVERPEPADKSKNYDSYWFDMFRIKNGKLSEHWDNALK